MAEHTPTLSLDPETQLVTVEDADPTISVIWDQAAQAAVAAEATGPTIGSRAFAMVHTAIYDAFASYDPVAAPSTVDAALQQDADSNTHTNKAAAMSWAAFTVLSDLFPDQTAIFEAAMDKLDLGSDPVALAPGSPEALGHEIGQAILEDRADDGANQSGDYADTTGYAPVNTSPFNVADIARWTPEAVPIDPETADPDQSFLTPQWGEVRPFALDDGAALRPPAPTPFFVPGVEASLDIAARMITLEGGEMLEVSPDLVGGVINPGFIEQAEEVVAFSAGLTEEQKLIAEFWEDGTGTAFPPGTWMTFGQFVSARDGHDLDADAKMFLALANAVMDAGIATWEAKVHYDYARPVRAIRELGDLGLIGTPGTDELTGETGSVIQAWAGPGNDGATVLAENFITYQTPGSDVSPPFAEYTSGHSGFSAAGAAVLALYAGSDSFGAGVEFAPGSSRFEPGLTPSETLTLTWNSFTDAADEGGISRLYGGIHFDDGDLYGRELGRAAGEAAFREAMVLISGGDDAPPELTDALIVERMFEAALGRVAQSAGRDFWEDAAGAGFDEVQLADAFLNSSEFTDRFGTPGALGAEGLVDRLFLNLGLDSAGTDLDETLAGALADGQASAAETLVALVSRDGVPPELADALTVGRMFEAALGRVAQFAGLNFWKDAAGAGVEEVQLADAFLTSSEFTGRFGTPGALGAEGLVDTLFLNLGLDAVETDLDETLLGALADGQASAAETLVALVESPEVAEATAYLAALNETGDGAIWFA